MKFLPGYYMAAHEKSRPARALWIEIRNGRMTRKDIIVEAREGRVD